MLITSLDIDHTLFFVKANSEASVPLRGRYENGALDVAKFIVG